MAGQIKYLASLELATLFVRPSPCSFMSPTRNEATLVDIIPIRVFIEHESMPQFCNREFSSQAHMHMRDIFMQTAARARMARDIETYKERDRVSEGERARETERE